MSPTLVCYADGASRGNPGPAGAGVVVLDENGRERRVVSLFLGGTTNNVAEYLALQEALRAASVVCRESWFDESRTLVVIKTDSELASKQLSGRYQVKAKHFAPLIQGFRDLARRFSRVDVVQVPREENARADKLANEAIDRALKAAGEAARGVAGGGGGPPPPGTQPAGWLPAAAPGSRPYSRLSHLECSRCGERLDPSRHVGSCPSCQGPLLARYDLAGFTWPCGGPGAGLGPTGGRPEDNSIWRYHELLPVTSPVYVVSLGEGRTPFVPLVDLERQTGLGRVLVKDEGRNPSGSFKARGASVAVSRLVELGVRRCAVPTSGRAGVAFAAYAARAGLECLAAIPEDAPEAVRLACEGYGAVVKIVPGLITEAAAYVRERAPEGWFSVATFDEPARLEGKKTLAFEIFEAFGDRWPDALVFPVGGGTGLVAAWKAAAELAEAGLAAKRPRLFAVQAAGCSPVVRAFVHGEDETRLFEDARTLALGLRVPAPKAGFLVLRALRATGGGAVAVPDEEILRVADRAARRQGLDLCPEGAAAVAALPEIARRGWFDGCRDVVVVNTGSSLPRSAGLA